MLHCSWTYDMLLRYLWNGFSTNTKRTMGGVYMQVTLSKKEIERLIYIKNHFHGRLGCRNLDASLTLFQKGYLYSYNDGYNISLKGLWTLHICEDTSSFSFFNHEK